MKKQLFILLTALLPFYAFAQTTEKEKARLVSSLARELMHTANLPGISVAISKQGKIVYAKGFGYADLENKRPVTPRTQFRTASVAKVITATALGKLMSEGKVDLDAPIQKYVPLFPEKKAVITSRQLAGHLSGLPHYSANDRLENRAYTSISDALSVFSLAELISNPGAEYHYSTHGYTLLSGVIEGASQTDFLKYMQEEVFRPLKMKNTGPDIPLQASRKMTSLYRLKNGTLSKMGIPENSSYKWGAGGLISTPTDLIRLANAYFNGFLKPEVVKTMFQSQHLSSGEKTQVGIGWRLSWDADGRRVLEHAGSMGGARSVICIFPEEQVAIALMTNAEWSSMIEETAHLLAIPFLSEQPARAQPQGTFPVNASLTNLKNEKEALQGELALANGKGKLILTPPLSTKQMLPLIYLKSENIYALVRPDGIFRLTLDVNGDLVSGSVLGYGSPLRASPATHAPFLSFTGTRKNETKTTQ